MSGKNNVNPSQYKIAGRDRPNELVSPKVKEAYTQEQARLEKQEGPHIPNQEDSGVKPKTDDNE